MVARAVRYGLVRRLLISCSSPFRFSHPADDIVAGRCVPLQRFENSAVILQDGPHRLLDGRTAPEMHGGAGREILFELGQFHVSSPSATRAALSRSMQDLTNTVQISATAVP